MTDRAEIERLLRQLHEARMEGDLPGLLSTFADDVRFRIAGASDGKPIAINVRGVAQVRSWMAVMVKSFSLTDYRLLSLLVDGDQAAAYWQVTTQSRITGLDVPTELVDLLEVKDGKIVSYTEFFTPRSEAPRG